MHFVWLSAIRFDMDWPKRRHARFPTPPAAAPLVSGQPASLFFFPPTTHHTLSLSATPRTSFLRANMPSVAQSPDALLEFGTQILPAGMCVVAPSAHLPPPHLRTVPRREGSALLRTHRADHITCSSPSPSPSGRKWDMSACLPSFSSRPRRSLSRPPVDRRLIANLSLAFLRRQSWRRARASGSHSRTVRRSSTSPPVSESYVRSLADLASILPRAPG